MALQYLCCGVAAVAMAGSITLASVSAQRRDGGLLPPEETGLVTVIGCLLRGDQIQGGDPAKYVLANPQKAPGTRSGETCTAERSAAAVQLDNPERVKLTESMLGHWIEVTGRLERETSTDRDNLRELDVEHVTLLSVDVPRAR